MREQVQIILTRDGRDGDKDESKGTKTRKNNGRKTGHRGHMQRGKYYVEMYRRTPELFDGF